MNQMFREQLADNLRRLLPAIGLTGVLLGIYAYQPNAIGYTGLTLLLTYAVPVLLAAFAQMFIIAAGDIDLSIGTFVSLVTCIAATVLADQPVFGLACIALLILAYVLIGILVHRRRLPSIVVTLGFSFIWWGIAVLLLPQPGGVAPGWLTDLAHFKTPLLPFPPWIAILVAAVGYFLLQQWSYGVILRGVGGNAKAVGRAGWSVTKAKAVLYGLAGFFGVMSGLVLTGIATSGDANIAPNYALLSVAAVILGGGEFVGGKVSPIGTVIGAITLVLINSLLVFMHVSSDWQPAAQGLILIVVLGARAAIARLETGGAQNATF